ncbi:MAG: putative glycoside hydrolase [Candidatus Paceibacterota bacterium]
MTKPVIFSVVGLASVLAVLSNVPIPRSDLTYDRAVTVVDANQTDISVLEKAEVPPPIDNRKVVKHVPLPSQVKSIYMTSCVAGTPSFREKLIKLMEETEINSVVIDIKDYSGTISFPPVSPAWQYAWENARCGTRDMEDLIATIHAKGFFVIGRITVFQDPVYAVTHPELAVLKASDGSVWKDGKGLSFIDVASKPYWDHIIELSVNAYNIGFDELNFDYVRYPSDGNMQDIAFPNSMKSEYGADKQANLEAFFKYLNETLDDETLYIAVRHENTGRASSTPYTSADLFGMTTTNFDDLSIGQVQDRAAPYFDFIAPMVYPSHYPKSFLGLGNPNDYPYKVVNYAMQAGVNRMMSSTTPMKGFLHERVGTSTPAVYSKPVYTADKLRTWIQDFDYGGDYDAVDVRAQIQASYDAGVNSWMLWAPSNIYTKEALFGPGVLEVAINPI